MNHQDRRLYEFGRFRLDTAERRLWRDGEPVTLSAKAFETLVALLERSGHLVGKDELMREVWPDSYVEESNLTNNISTLRKALGEGEGDGGRRYIETVPKCGYRFVAEVRELSDEVRDLPARSGQPINDELIVERHTFRRTITQEVEQKEEGQSQFDETPLDGARALRATRTLQIAAPPGSLVAAPRPPASLVDQLRSPRVGLAVVAAAALLVAATSVFWWRQLRAATTKTEMTFERLTNGGDVRGATLSPDGEYFVYAVFDGTVSRLLVRQIEQDRPVEIVPAAEREIIGTTFSPDGRFVYFIARDRQESRRALYRVPALGGPLAKLLSDISSPVAFSPDGRRIAFTRFDEATQAGSLVVASADGGDEKVLLVKSRDEGLLQGVAWSPDGRRIACELKTVNTATGGASYSVGGVDARTGAVEPLTAQQWDNCGRMAWTGDGRGLILIGTRQGESGTVFRDQVWYVSQPGGEVRRLTDGMSRHFYESLGVAADSSALLVIPYNRTSQIWSLDAGGDARSVVQLTTGTADGRGGIAPLPGDRLAFVRRTGNHVDVWEMNADGTGQRQLTNDPPFLEELRATPDGRHLVFASNRDGRSHLFRVDTDGSNLLQLTGGESVEIDSDCSPDGRWIVYSSYPSPSERDSAPSLLKVSVDGGTPARLGSARGYSPHFSPDGKLISYTFLEAGRWKLAVAAADDGALVRTFDPVEAPELSAGCRFTPDGLALTYIAVQKATSNIWLQPLDGGVPRPLTDFKDGEIYNYAFSRDGARLFLARGYDIHDALLIRGFSR